MTYIGWDGREYEDQEAENQRRARLEAVRQLEEMRHRQHTLVVGRTGSGKMHAYRWLCSWLRERGYRNGQ